MRSIHGRQGGGTGGRGDPARGPTSRNEWIAAKEENGEEEKVGEEFPKPGPRDLRSRTTAEEEEGASWLTWEV
jgi:hypothetical protein